MTGSNFYNYILKVFKRTDKETEVYEAITDVIMDIKLTYFFEDFKTIDSTLAIDTLGSFTIDVPSDFGHLLGRIVMIDDSGGSKPLTKRSKEKFDDMYPDINGSDPDNGVPQDFCLYGKKFYIGPVPDSTLYKYQINYSSEGATEITSSTESVPFTDRYRKKLRQLVLSELYYNLGYDEEGRKFKTLGEEGLGDMIANDQFNTRSVGTVAYNDC